MDEYWASIVNIFLPLRDIDLDSGPVQLVKQSSLCLRLTKHETLQKKKQALRDAI